MIPYIIKSFRGGISDENKRGIAGSFKYGYNLNIHSRDDVLKCGSTVATVEESLINDLIMFFVPSADGSTYAFGSAGSIYARSGDYGWNFVFNDTNGEITGASEFEHSDGTRYMYWATATSVSRRDMSGAKDLPWTNATHDYKTTLNSVDYHTMKIASGQLNIANGNDLASIDYTGDFVASDLDLIPGNIIKCLEERDDYIILGSERSDRGEEGHIWSWFDGADTWVQKKKIPVKGVNSLIATENLLAQAGANGGIFYTNFVDQIPLSSIPGGGQVNPGGTSILDMLAVFGFYGGTYPGIWSYGRKQKDRGNALNYEYRLAKTTAGSSVSEIGAIEVINGDLLASWKTTDGSTSDYGVDQVSSTTVANSIYEGIEFDGGNPHLNKTIDNIALVMSPLNGGTVSAKFKLDKESDWRYAVLGSGATTYSEVGGILAIFSIGKPARIYEVGTELNTNGFSNSNAGTVVNTDGGEGILTDEWTDVNNALVSDDVYAVSTPGSGDKTDFLDLTNFGFSIRDGITITGIKAEVERKVNVASGTKDVIVQLIVNGTAQGTNNADTTLSSWSQTEETKVYGSSTNLWGLTLTNDDINASNFGIRLQAEATSTGRTFSIDSVRLTIYYYTINSPEIHSVVSYLSKETSEYDG